LLKANTDPMPAKAELFTRRSRSSRPAISVGKAMSVAVAPAEFEEAAAIVPIRSVGSTRRRASAPVRTAVVRHRPAADRDRRKRCRRARRSPSSLAPARGAVPLNVPGSWQNRRQREVWSRSLLNASSSFDAARAVMGWSADELACLTLAHRRASKQGEITAPKRSDRMPRRSNGQLPPRRSAGG
jgi:hypothetical protein